MQSSPNDLLGQPHQPAPALGIEPRGVGDAAQGLRTRIGKLGALGKLGLPLLLW